MKLCFTSLGCPAKNATELADFASKEGFEGIELRSVSNTVDLRSLDDFKPENIDATRKMFNDRNVDVVNIGSNIRFTRPGAQAQLEQLKEAEDNLLLAKSLGAKYIRVFGGPFDPAYGYTESLQWIVDGYKKMVRLAEDVGVMPLLETHDDFSSSVWAMELINNVDHDYFGIVWDIVHPYRFGEEMEQTWERMHERIRHVHLKDCHKFNRKIFDIAFFGEGNIPVQEAVNILCKNNYDGYLCFEWEKLWHPEIADGEIAIPHYKKVVTQMIEAAQKA